MAIVHNKKLAAFLLQQKKIDKNGNRNNDRVSYLNLAIKHSYEIEFIGQLLPKSKNLGLNRVREVYFASKV